jgi:tetratricopeptide (TPR) repeat protein
MNRATSVLDTVVDLHAKARDQYNQVHPLSALRTLRRALRMLDEHSEAAESERGQAVAAAIWISLALNEAEVNGLEAGLVALSEASRRADLVGDPALQVRVHGNHALLATRAGRFDVALAEFDAAMALADAADPPDHFGILLNSGNLHLFRGELEQARQLLAAAADFAQANDYPVGRYMALHNLGYARFLGGSLPQALDTMDAAARLGLDNSQGIPLLDRARVLAEGGLSGEADETLARAASIFARDRLSQDLGETEVARAECALQVDDFAAARQFAARARDRFRRRGNDRWRRTAELVLLQGDLAAGRPGARLAPVALRLAGELRADGMATRAATADLLASEALLSAGQTEAAREVVASIPSLLGAPIALRLHSRYVRARLEQAAGRRGRAQRQARHGLDELAAYQASFGGIDLQTASAVHGRRLADLDVAVAIERGSPDLVLAAVERGRAVSSRLSGVHPPADEQAAGLLTELRQVVESVRAQQGDDAQLQARRAELERAIKERAWAVAGGGLVQQPSPPEAIRAEAGAAGAALIAYVALDGWLRGLVSKPGATSLCELGPVAVVDEQIRRVRADLDVLALTSLPGELYAVAAGSLARSLGRLDELLLAPLDVCGERLVVIPTGLLATLPWTLLPSRHGLPVVVSPSGTAWLAGRAQREQPRSQPIVALAGPDLQRASEEVDAIGRVRRDCRTVTGAQATRIALAEAMGAADVVHVAAHGRHQTGNPLFSSLRLADGPLFAHELERTAPHVVLSACESGLATVRPGDEALGLTSVLLHLGTRSVVSGMARISDEVAAEAMVTYHRLLAAGHDSAQALAGAVAAANRPLPMVCFGSEWTRPGH